MKYLPYLLPLFLLAGCSPTGVDEQLLQNMIQSQEQAARVMEEQNEVVVRNLEELLQDDSKIKFRPIKTAIDSMQTYLNTFRDQIDATSATLANLPGKAAVELPRTLRLSHEIPATLLEFKRNYYRVQADSVGLAPEEAASRIQNMQEQFSQYNLSLPENGLNSALEQRCWLSKLRSDIAGIESLIVNSMAELSGGRTLRCFFGYLPTVLNIQRSGLADSLLQRIIILDAFELSESAKNISLFINNEKVDVYQGIYATYECHVSESADSIALSGHYFNPLIGERGDLFGVTPFMTKAN